MFREKQALGFYGWLMLFLFIALLIVGVYGLISAAHNQNGWAVGGWFLLLTSTSICLAGFIVVNPNEAKVVLLFGNYKGTLKQAGLWWMNPFNTKRTVSLRIRNFETAKLKVNDHVGNPIDIAAIVVWQVVETAEAIFNVDDYEHFVHVQSEAAVRNLST